MAFENLNTFTDELKERYQKAEQTTIKAGTPVERQAAYARMDEVLGVMGQYYLTVLKRSQFKAQRFYCLATIRELSPGYAEGLTMKGNKPESK